MKLFIAEKTQKSLDKKILILKLEDQNEAGIASLTSWPHLGDTSLADLKLDLLSDQNHSLVQKSLYFAMKDLKQENLKNITLPESHKLIQDEKYLATSPPFNKLKLKPKQNFEKLAETLNALNFKANSLRLDFNNKLSFDEFYSFLKLCHSKTLEAFDFIEDPFAYEEKLWAQIKADFPNLSLALDHSIEFNQPCFDFYIWKPAKSFYPNISCNIVPTHYMSDEIEWYCSLWEASEKKLLNNICGFGTEHLLNLDFKAGDMTVIKKHWNQNLDDFSWHLLSENFQLTFKLP
ncbi:MAG: hypothetical protein MK008_05525 [Bdellovibrionales bacterium]|nr:hypothetical protein [Bdellovibrionales bacterium]